MGSERILVVDDEKRIVKTISARLEREGLACDGAYDGEQAVSLYGRKRFDLVLLDLSMPGMNGFQVMETILGQNKDAMVIIMTGFASVESAVKALKQGAWDYLKKPFDLVDLVKAVKNGLAQQQLLADKKAVSARLEASEKQFENMVNNSPDLIFTLDESGRFAFVNDLFESLLGIPRKTLLGSRFESLVYKPDRPRARKWLQPGKPAREAPGRGQIHLRFKKAGAAVSKHDPYGAFRFMELKASPIYLPAMPNRKEQKGIYAVARDVTDRVNLEAQLRQAQKMEALGTLAGGIAHDFNNILMGIQGYASLVKAGFDKDSMEYKRLASIDEYVFSGAEMARQLLGFAQNSSYEPCPVNLNYLLKMSAKMFGRTKKDIIIESDLAKKLWGTLVDEGQIKQVLMNLFVNAWQAMPEGGRIMIRSENVVVEPDQAKGVGVKKSGPYVKITVKDTGIGMDSETMTRIFDPFFTTKEREQGTGLGLATAYGIIRSHRGAFKVESQPGKGSTFIFYLPAKDAHVAQEKKGEKEGKLISGKGTILLVDDEKGVIEVCSEMIETLGYEVMPAASGFEAVKMMNKAPEKIDLVILDMIMPGMNGDETFDLLRRIKPDVRVLVSSGYSKEDEVRQMIDKGCKDFISKPFDVVTLSEKLSAVFNS